MNTAKIPQKSQEEIKVSVKHKLKALWISFVFMYIYVDYYHLYMPSKIDEILRGRVFEFEITQGFLLIALVSVTIPTLMIVLSVILSNRINRRVNVIIATVYIPYTLFNLAGEAWGHMVFAAIVEITLLCLIIYYARKLPIVEI